MFSCQATSRISQSISTLHYSTFKKTILNGDDFIKYRFEFSFRNWASRSVLSSKLSKSSTHMWVRFLRGSNIFLWMFPISIPSMLLWHKSFLSGLLFRKPPSLAFQYSLTCFSPLFPFPFLTNMQFCAQDALWKSLKYEPKAIFSLCWVVGKTKFG